MYPNCHRITSQKNVYTRQGCTLGWYASAPLGRRNAPKGQCIPAQGNVGNLFMAR